MLEPFISERIEIIVDTNRLDIVILLGRFMVEQCGRKDLAVLSFERRWIWGCWAGHKEKEDC